MNSFLILTALLLNFNCLIAFGAEDNIDYLNHPSRKESIAGNLYEGVFEDGTAFFMSIPTTKLDAKTNKSSWATGLSATYWYPRKFAGNKIPLQLRSLVDGIFLIEVHHFDDKSNKDSLLETFEITLSSDKSIAHGLWKNINRKKQMSFSMHRVVEYKQIYVSLPFEGDKSINPDRKFEFTAIFPVFGDIRDEWVRKVASSCDFDLVCDNNIEIAWFSTTSMSLLGSVWTYAAGAPHGYGYSTYQHFDTSGTKPKPVLLDYFVNTSPSCLDRLSNKIVSSLEKQGLSDFNNGDIGDWKKRINYLPTPTGIQFDFNLYEVGAYTEGAPTVFVEREKIGNCLKHLPSYEPSR